MADVIAKPIKCETMMVTIVGTTPLLQHKWSEKALKEMRDKKQGRKTKDRVPCDPAKESDAATYRTTEGVYGVPVLAVKAALIGAAHKDIGIEKTLVRKALFLHCDDKNGVLPMRCGEPAVREDFVRVAKGSTDLRYRPEFAAGWELDLKVEYDTDLLTQTDIVNLFERAGFGVGICEWRPEKGGDFGRFRVKQEKTK